MFRPGMESAGVEGSSEEAKLRTLEEEDGPEVRGKGNEPALQVEQEPGPVDEEEELRRETQALWEREQSQLKAHVITGDTEEWQRNPGFSGLQRVGGVDLSFIKGDDVNACASLVVLSYPELEVIYEECQMVCLTAPYVAGFLAFREVPSLVNAIERLQGEDPSLMPQVLLVDGNGILHHRGFGVACHLGVLTGLPCVGVAKNLLQVDGLENNERHKEQALKSCDKSAKPIYVSVGHKISLESAVHLVGSCCKYRTPEPIRQADIRSREYIRKNFPEHVKTEGHPEETGTGEAPSAVPTGEEISNSDPGFEALHI
ncbi:endonuclease V isoform X2 [Lissotriton helveticus]